MTDLTPEAIVYRRHGNGMVASVFLLPEEFGENRFGYGAAIPGSTTAYGDVLGPEKAKALADEASNCGQPCTCRRGHRSVTSEFGPSDAP